MKSLFWKPVFGRCGMRRVVLGAVGLVLMAGMLSAREPWSDQRLAQQEGLELWLDASAQNGARQALQLPLLAHDSGGDFWFDSSGHGRHVSQRNLEQRPRFRQLDDVAAFRFDGVDDFLSLSGGGTTFSNCTIFVVATPRSNPGFFRGFISLSRLGVNDYTSGVNLDLGGGAGERWSVINAEGAGFNGQRNLLKSGSTTEFGEWRVISLTVSAGAGGVKLCVDGEPQEARDRQRAVMAMDEVAIGARILSNSVEPPFVQCQLDGDLAEVLVYSRALDDRERQSVEEYLLIKHAAWRNGDGKPTGVRPLEVVENPAPVQMLVPGFAAQELPVKIPNINNVGYRSDGKLVALGYNGHIWLLTDEDGDGLEESAKPFWNKDTMRGPIGMALTPPDYALGQGVFVPSKGKLSLIVDRDGDDVADEEIIVATGWDEIPQNVDAVGCALDEEGNIYFGLGCANFANGYLVDPESGRAGYDLGSERGTILKVSPDFSRREIVSTGVRFPVALHFNEEGDLFATDQEGATWLPNGNPFDELLHIQEGRHYGFPPRHPKHLPEVIDEPSVYDYAPQHQSTCGFCFNTPLRGLDKEARRDLGRPAVFGPEWWAGDALVTGESRGKLYRTKLVKTEAGYVAQNDLIGCVAALAVDVCLSPAGDLVVATHSGKPDWGTGPEGIGSLYKIAYRRVDLPQPVRAWSAGPTEIHIAFDRALEPERLRNVVQESRITQGRYVSPGDQFEAMWPGYQVIHSQKAVPRYNIPVLSAGVTADHRNLVLTTPPRRAAVNYAIELPGSMVGAGPVAGEGEGSMRQKNVIELGTDMNGVTAVWRSADGESSWEGWLPHVDLQVSKELTQASAAHERLWELIDAPGELTVRGQLDLWEMLQPPIQAGAALDYQRPVEMVHVQFTGPVRALEGSASVSSSGQGVRFAQASAAGRWLPIELVIATGNENPAVSCSWSTDLDPRPRALPLRRFFLPWAEPGDDPIDLTDRRIPEIEGGDWMRGRELFFSEEAACAKCHQMNGLGSKLGPDLSNLVHRDYASVLKDIREPGAAINPDHIAYQVALANGEERFGVLTADNTDSLILGDASGAQIELAKSEVRSIQASTLSLMPEGLDVALGEERMKDLLTFLLMPPPLEAAPIEGRTEPPPPRKRAEVEALLSKLETGVGQGSPEKVFKVVLCDGPKDHGPGEHDYPMWKRRWTTLLSLAEGVEVDNAHIWPSEEQFATADVIAFFNNNPGWNRARAEQLDAYLDRGGGAAYFHWAVEAREDAAAFARRIGLASNGSRLKYRHGPIDLVFHEHPLAEGFDRTHFTRAKFIDETYWNFVGDPGDVKVLASAREEGEQRPQLWTREIGAGRVFVSIPGHYNWTFDDPVFRVLALRGLCWAGRQPVDRLAPLAMVGARVVE